MAGINTAVFGIYSTKAGIETAVIALQAAGFRSADISALLPGPMGSQELVTEKTTKAPEGALTGAGSGAVIGGALGWLVGIGALAIPGLGPFIAAGPIAAALAGIGVGSSVGGVAGALIGLGIPEYEAKRYEGHVTKGGSLLSVHCYSSYWVQQAKEIMENTGAEDISVATVVSEGQPEAPGASAQPRTNELRTGAEPQALTNADQGTKDYQTSIEQLPTTEEIERRAYEIYLTRGGAQGHDLEDWLNAERELKESHRTRSVLRPARATARA